MNRADLRVAFSHPNVQAFARVVREGESRQDELAYRMRFGGHGKKPVYFDDLSKHPKQFEPTASGDRSSAAGAYQATWTTWNEEQAKWGWPDFSPKCQDEFFVARLIYRGALKSVVAGEFTQACALCKQEWTSLPGGAEENAATKRARETYIKWGGRFSATQEFNPDSLSTEHYEGPEPYRHTPQPKEAKMAVPVPLILAGLQILKDLFPAVTAALKSDNVRERNVEIGAALLEAATKATSAANEQEALERIQNDPGARAAAQAAIYQILPTIVEAGGGGLEGARKAAESQSGDWRKLVFSLPFVALLAFLPTIWAVVAGAVFKAPWLLEMDPQLRGTVIGFVMGTIAGGIVMYVYGASMTKSNPSNR